MLNVICLNLKPWVLVPVLGVLVACQGAPVTGSSEHSSHGQISSDASSQGESGSSSSWANTDVAHQPEDLSRCLAPQGHEIKTIASTLAWINAMPKPLTLVCFIASIPRPILYNATQSPISAQLSLGRHNPRIFLATYDLWLSYVPQEPVLNKENAETGELTTIWDADNIQLLELSEVVASDYKQRQSIKGEIAFPVFSELPASAPYQRVSIEGNNAASLCGGCHNNETPVAFVDEIPVFRSAMLRNPFGAEVGDEYLLNQYATCDPDVNTGNGLDNNEWYRCQMLEATFGQGSMYWYSFPSDIPTFFD